jgi:hypothetical protein
MLQYLFDNWQVLGNCWRVWVYRWSSAKKIKLPFQTALFGLPDYLFKNDDL